MVGDDMLEPALRWLNYTVETELLMNEIEDATTRISTLVGDAKQYSQLDRAPFQVVDVHDLLDSTLLMMSAKIGPTIKVVKDYDRSLPGLPGYASELNQVWTNMIDNAVSAMGGTGTLTIRTARDGDCALIEIGDTGPGIPAEIKNRIFEPFFSTKPVGEGTGLGLDIAWRIVVNKHHGDLQVESVPGDTRFEIRLPLEAPTTDCGGNMTEMQGVDPSVPPSGPGCVECEADQGWWLHLRRCTQCGHIGCCDNSPAQHATRHAKETGHPVIRSYEPGEEWFWSYPNEDFYETGPELAAPMSHPADQRHPGPDRPRPAQLAVDAEPVGPQRMNTISRGFTGRRQRRRQAPAGPVPRARVPGPADRPDPVGAHRDLVVHDHHGDRGDPPLGLEAVHRAAVGGHHGRHPLRHPVVEAGDAVARASPSTPSSTA